MVAPRQWVRQATHATRVASARATVDVAGELSVEAVDGRNAAADVIDAWRAVTARQARVRFVHWHAWFASYVESLADDPDAVRVLVVRRGSTPIAVAPLVHRRQRIGGWPVRVWSLPEHPHLPLADIVCASGVDAAAVAGALFAAFDRLPGRGRDVLRFASLPADSPFANLRKVPRSLLHRRVAKTCDEVECAGSYDEIRAGFSRNFRSNLNRARNKLARETDVEFLTATRGAGLDDAYREFLDLEASGWKGAAGAGTAIKLHADLRNFYGGLLARLPADGRLVVNRLLVGGRAVASQLCLKDRDTLYVLKLAYDEKRSRIAPGNMLLERVIRKGVDDGAWRFVNLVGNPPWFADWNPAGTDVSDVWLCARTPAGVLTWLLLGVKALLGPRYRRLARRLQNLRRRKRRRRPSGGNAAGRQGAERW